MREWGGGARRGPKQLGSGAQDRHVPEVKRNHLCAVKHPRFPLSHERAAGPGVSNPLSHANTRTGVSPIKSPHFTNTPPLKNFFFSFSHPPSPRAAGCSGAAATAAIHQETTHVSQYLGVVTFPVAVQEHPQEERQRHHEAQRHEDGGVDTGRPVQLVCGENKRTQSAPVVATVEITRYSSGGG